MIFVGLLAFRVRCGLVLAAGFRDSPAGTGAAAAGRRAVQGIGTWQRIEEEELSPERQARAPTLHHDLLPRFLLS